MREISLFDLDSSAEDGPAKETAWLDGVLEWLTAVADSGGKSCGFLPISVPLSFLEKTSLEFCPSAVAPPAQESELSTFCTENEAAGIADALDAMPEAEFLRLTRAEIGGRCWATWQSWGMGSHTGFSTLSGSDWPKDAAVCLLSDILVTGNVPLKYFLSPTACLGILRRAEKRGKTLPEHLKRALMEVVRSQERQTGVVAHRLFLKRSTPARVAFLPASIRSSCSTNAK